MVEFQGMWCKGLTVSRSHKSHPDLEYVREKPCPFYETWVDMYGKDNAMGNDVFDFNGATSHAGSGHGLEDIEETTAANTSPPNPFAENVGQSQTPSQLLLCHTKLVMETDASVNEWRDQMKWLQLRLTCRGMPLRLYER